ncbi:unnamed protein product, partial [Rotaria socialis]
HDDQIHYDVKNYDDQIHYDARNHDDRLFQSSNDDNFTSKA